MPVGLIKVKPYEHSKGHFYTIKLNQNNHPDKLGQGGI